MAFCLSLARRPNRRAILASQVDADWRLAMVTRALLGKGCAKRGSDVRQFRRELRAQLGFDIRFWAMKMKVTCEHGGLNNLGRRRSCQNRCIVSRQRRALIQLFNGKHDVIHA